MIHCHLRSLEEDLDGQRRYDGKRNCEEEPRSAHEANRLLRFAAQLVPSITRLRSIKNRAFILILRGRESKSLIFDFFFCNLQGTYQFLFLYLKTQILFLQINQ